MEFMGATVNKPVVNLERLNCYCGPTASVTFGVRPLKVPNGKGGQKRAMQFNIYAYVCFAGIHMSAFVLLLQSLIFLASFGSLAYAGPTGYIENMCNFPVYVSCARGDGDATSIYKLGAHRAWNCPYQSYGLGISMKVSPESDSGMNHPYQAEYTAKDNYVGFNLSHEDGTPFVNYGRLFQCGRKRGAFKDVYCKPGDSSCDWPVYKECPTNDMHFYLCASDTFPA
ncbi:hypothetical protein M501DRAFT_1014268 [Patellaria atrata CBS 101060]|uniref:Uncharacterized protein n=1 Tax=Patellaria atrata CBS 101060 TaxID=1346257 RepID=A0A9P4VVB0_9PEZI|nr:hypothetical protein M501DRAFT_1014268 [Patellaria atrata CBS 101060]